MRKKIFFLTRDALHRRLERFDIKDFIRNRAHVIVLVVFSAFSVLLIAGKYGGMYVDGVYTGISKAMYSSENYYGKTRITVQNGYITKVDFQIVDSVRGEAFNERYEYYFKGNTEYVNQCRSDWRGVQVYPARLVRYQQLKDIDTIRGATWSYNLFTYSAREALSRARKK